MANAQQPSSTHSVSWGKVVAGAAVATGVVLMGMAMGGADVLDSLKELVVSWFKPGTAPEVPGTFDALGQFLKDHGTALTGALLTGGGLAYFGMAGDGGPQVSTAQPDMETARMGFAAREQMRAANAMMQARMMAANPEYRQMMAAQQQGM